MTRYDLLVKRVTQVYPQVLSVLDVPQPKVLPLQTANRFAHLKVTQGQAWPVTLEHSMYRRNSFNCKYLLFTNGEFFSTQLLQLQSVLLPYYMSMRKPYMNAIIKKRNACENAGTQLFCYAIKRCPTVCSHALPGST